MRSIVSVLIAAASLGCVKAQPEPKVAQERQIESKPVCDSISDCRADIQVLVEQGKRQEILPYIKQMTVYEPIYTVEYGILIAELDGVHPARDIWKGACEREIAKACRQLGISYALDEPKDFSRADSPLRKACKLGDQEGCYNLAYLISTRSIDGTQNDAIRIYWNNCQSGHESSCKNVAVLFATRDLKGDQELAALIFRDLCEGYQDASSCADYGSRLFFGDGVKKNQADGFKYLSLGCEMNSSYSCALYGVRLSEVAKTEEEKKTVDGVYVKGCELNSGRACLWLARWRKSHGSSHSSVVLLFDKARDLLMSDCLTDLKGRACWMVGDMIQKSETSLESHTPETLMKKGCRYDQRVCEW